MMLRFPAILVILMGLGVHSARAQSRSDVKSLLVGLGGANPTALTLRGRDAAAQLIITGRSSDDRERDLTREVKYAASPEGILTVDATGYVTALKEGKATIQVTGPAGLSTALAVTVADFDHDLPVNFVNDVVPVFTRFGCNAGGCHGKSGGQNGFSLSLLGFEPAEDYEFLVKEARAGRRVTVSAPDASILLRKASGAMAHGGGSRIKSDTAAYRLLRRWVEQGAPYGNANDPVVSRIEVLPRERILETDAAQQLIVVAHYSDGSTRDVTRLAQFESNNADIAVVSETGLVSTLKLPGSAAVMARFQAHVDAFRTTIPLGQPIAKLPPSRGAIDDLVFARLKKLGLPPSEMCDDATFLRRVTIDLAGRLPTIEETEAFLKETSADKRDKLIDRLLANGDYADYFASKWSAVLRNKRNSPKEDSKPTVAFHGWIRQSLHENRPFDEFVRAILTATGEEVANPPVAWYREVKDAFAQVEDTCQLFLGVRIGCARCHHHPMEKLSQQDYYGIAAFFSQVEFKVPPKVVTPKGQKPPPKNAAKPPVHVIHKVGVAKSINPRSGAAVLPTALGGKGLEIPADADPRVKLAEWVTSKDNPLFAKALVNRYWKHFFGRGLVDPEDDLRVTNPPANPELLDALAKSFVDSGFDIKKLARAICTSSVYQLASTPNKHNEDDVQNFSRFVPRRLQAEVLFDAIDQLTLAKPEFPGIPAGTRAVQLPDNAFDSYFLTLFGRPDASSACECERSSTVGLPQLLHLMNSREIIAKVSGVAPKVEGKAPKGKPAPPSAKVAPGQRLAKLAADKRPHEEKIRELYLTAYTREPTKEETTLLLGHLERNAANVRAAYEDVLWVLVNSEEFLFNH